GSGHPPAPVASIDTAAWRRAIDIVLTGTWLCMKHEIRQMVKQGSGSIVNVASTVGMKGWPYLAGYGAAKAGMIHLTRTAAIETAKQGIRINAISPGPVATEMVASAVRDSPDVEQQILATVPMGRISEPEETIELVLWLSSDKASYVTGANYVLDGGQTA
ncbi:MAG: SDR family oxidoreductase, partial [Steroidobacteraceae bacterium]